jgi:uncharacterized protein YabN with tetrapyrrole methylase and pyrophosphatase domain
MKEVKFEEVRDWSSKRGIKESAIQMNYQRFMQEAIEIHEALVLEDEEEFQDAIGDTIVTLINLAKAKGYRAEDCLSKAFNVIKLRKGLITKAGDFKRYGKLDQLEKEVCDKQQGNPGSEYFLEEDLDKLNPENFKN